MARGPTLSARLAMLAALTVCADPGVCGTLGGTITFVGRVVAPSYVTSIAPMAQSAGYSASATAAEVHFQGTPGTPLSANVQVEGLGKSSLVVRCSHASSEGLKSVPVNGCHVGPAGGALSVEVKGTPPPGAPPGAIVTVSYD